MKFFKRRKYYRMNFWEYIVYVNNSEEEKALQSGTYGAVRITLEQVKELNRIRRLHYLINWRERPDPLFLEPHDFYDTMRWLADEDTKEKMKKIYDRKNPSWIPEIIPLIDF